MSRTRHSRTRRIAGVAAALGTALALTGCGFDVQTLQTYTPAHGVNFEITGADGANVKVRNLLVIANDQGNGRLSAAIVSNGKPDALTGVSGIATKQDGTPEGNLTITGADKIQLPAGKLVTLTGEGAPSVAVSGTGLKPGRNVTLQLTFASGGVKQLRVPVTDVKDPIYATAAPGL